jgi:hypothetical protein
MLHSMVIAQTLNTLFIPLLVNGKPPGGWPYSYLRTFLKGQYDAMMKLDSTGQIERGWYSARNAFIADP